MKIPPHNHELLLLTRMNKFYIGSLVGLLSVALSASAQCEPDFDFGEAMWGASPDASIGEQFDTAYVDVPYFDVFHVLVPVDASAIDPNFPLPLDSVILVSTTLVDTTSLETMGLPDIGLEIICNNLGASPDPCTLISGAQYCASLEGTPTTPGVFQMSLDVMAYVTIFGVAVGQPYQFSGYILDVVGEGNPDGIEESSAIQWELIPNPAEEYFQVQNIQPGSDIVIRDVSGRIVDTEVSWNRESNALFQTSSWPNGIYLISVQHSLGIQTQKLVVQH